MATKIKAEFVVLDGNSVEITMKLNEILGTFQESGATIKEERRKGKNLKKSFS